MELAQHKYANYVLQRAYGLAPRPVQAKFAERLR